LQPDGSPPPHARRLPAALLVHARPGAHARMRHSPPPLLPPPPPLQNTLTAYVQYNTSDDGGWRVLRFDLSNGAVLANLPASAVTPAGCLHPWADELVAVTQVAGERNILWYCTAASRAASGEAQVLLARSDQNWAFLPAAAQRRYYYPFADFQLGGVTHSPDTLHVYVWGNALLAGGQMARAAASARAP
jgi:hypothetical protein